MNELALALECSDFPDLCFVDGFDEKRLDLDSVEERWAFRDSEFYDAVASLFRKEIFQAQKVEESKLEALWLAQGIELQLFARQIPKSSWGETVLVGRNKGDKIPLELQWSRTLLIVGQGSHLDYLRLVSTVRAEDKRFQPSDEFFVYSIETYIEEYVDPVLKSAPPELTDEKKQIEVELLQLLENDRQ